MRYQEILLVDDEDKILRTMKQELKPYFEVIHCANNAAEAIDTLSKHPIALVITDYRMPGMNGAELVIHIYHKYPQIMSIIVSEQTDIYAIIQAINDGHLCHFLEKPCHTEKLLEVIQQSFHEAEQRYGKDILTRTNSLRRLNEHLYQLHQQMMNPPVLAVIDVMDLDYINRLQGVAKGNRLLQSISNKLIRHMGAKEVYRHGRKYMVLLPFDERLYDQVLQMCWLCDQEAPRALHVYVMDVPADAQPISDVYVSAMIQGHAYSFTQDVCVSVACRNPAKCELYQLFSIYQGLNDGDFHAFYQPQWDTEKQQPIGFEALARWQSKKGDWYRPEFFLPVIEKFNILELLTEKILQSVIQLIRQNHQLLSGFYISVNVPGRMLSNGCLYDLLVECTNLDVDLLEHLAIEITEQDLIDNFPLAKQELEKIKALGISCALDDFGTGYAGYEYLFEIPFDTLKIDGRFVRAIGENESIRVVLSSIIQSAHSFNMNVVAEWVETQEQVDFLQEVGCHLIQGHLVGEALSSQDVCHYLKTS